MHSMSSRAQKTCYLFVVSLWALALLIRILWSPYNMHSSAGESLWLFSHSWYTIDYGYLAKSYLIYTVFLIAALVLLSFVFSIAELCSDSDCRQAENGQA